MKENTPQKLNTSFVNGRLGLCAAALAGTAAAIPAAEATVVTNNINLSIPATLAGVYLDFLLGTTGSSSAAVPGWDFNPYLANGGTQLGFYWQTTSGGVAGDGTNYDDLPNGTVVSSSSTFNRVILGTTANYLSTGTHILGFKFFNEATMAVDFGYLTISTTASNGFPATLLSYSYENNGGPITVNVVPEPATAALLAVSALVLGAVGLRQWRRQSTAS